jgi:outer membrane protein OmpA-like peptidoglycan-associated protein
VNTLVFRKVLPVLAALCAVAAPLSAADVQLAAVQYPEGKRVDVQLVATGRVAPAQAEAEVKYRGGQATVEVEYENLPPATLFAGDVTSYVVWAVARDGAVENLGELIVRKPKGSAEFRAGQKEFAVLVTAEPFPLVLKPSELVVFASVAPPVKKARSTPVTLSNLVPAPAVGNPQIGRMTYSGEEPLDLLQARGVLDQAQRIGADKYNPDAIREATTTLAQATNSYKAGREKLGVDYARRSLSLSSTAIRDTQRRLAEEAAAAAAARRAAEMQSLEQQRTAAQQEAATAQAQALSAREQALTAREQAAAAQAQLALSQQQAAAAQQQAAAAQQQMTLLQQQAQQAQAESAAAQERAAAAGLSAEAADKARREADEARRNAESLASQATAARAEAERASAQAAAAAAALDAQRQQLEEQVGEAEAENARLRAERNDLQARLTGALSEVAEISQTARGVVVNLPDILFDINKATLKPSAQVAMGKLAGIVSVFPDINLRVEGHTDSTGTDAINDRLSHDRANAVVAFLRGQGVAARRMTAEGYGSRLPRADNSTVEGRAKNRRVEIILAEGVIRGAGQ